jgi:ferrochelatase
MDSNNRQEIGVVVAQLGTPDAPTVEALRRYLKQFLSDRRVIDYHPAVWQLILRGIILRTRPARSAKLYQRIWMQEGSPLLVYSQKQASGLQTLLGQCYRVVLGMTYGEPSIKHAVQMLESKGINRIIVLPLFPQFSSATTGSIYDAVYTAAAGKHYIWSHDHKRSIPTLRFVEPYYDSSGYILAMKAHLSETIAALPHQPDKYIISFHGLPERYVKTGDPYRQHSEQTATLLASAMGWRDDEWLLCFQSRFGREKWLAPYTDEVLTNLHNRNIQCPLVFSPSFLTDCLETLDELGNEGRHQFVEGGGQAESYTLAPCLNDHPQWLSAMAELVRQNSGGWIEDSVAAIDQRTVL